MRALAALALLSLAACGFRLVDSGPLPEVLRRVNVDMPLGFEVAEPPIEAALRAKLVRRGAEIVARAANASTQIRLSELTEQREILSLGGDGKALEYRLVIGVRYELLRDGTVLLGDRLSVARDYSFQLDQILQKELEEEQLRQYIQTELAELVLLRITTGLARLPPTAPVVPSPEPPPAG
jgi:LPS-assembly lipoprotein